MDRVELGVNKLKTSFMIIFLVVAPIIPAIQVDINNPGPEVVLISSMAVFFWYVAYRYAIKRLFMGSIITLTRESMTIKDNNTVYTYPWPTVRKIKVELVTEDSIRGKVSRTFLTVWTSTGTKADEFNISDLVMGGDEIRALINDYHR